MEIYFVCCFRPLQSKHSTSQYNMQRQTCCGRRQKTPNLQVDFQSVYFKIEYRFYYQINSIYKCFIIESNVLHWSVSYWESLSGKNLLYSLREHKGIETQLWKGNFNPINVFDDVRNKLVSAHCTVTLNVLTVTDENHKRCIFPILP